MIDATAILYQACRIAVVGMGVVTVGGLLAGNLASAGFYLAVLLVLAELLVLTLTVQALNRMLVSGGSGAAGLLGVFVLQGRFFITLFVLYALAEWFGMPAVAVGLVSGFVAYTLAAVHAAVLQMAVPLESM